MPKATTYQNTSRGARYIHLKTGSYVVVEAGSTHTIEDSKVLRVGPDLVKGKGKNDLPDPPAALVRQVADSKPPAEKPLKKMNKAELIAKAGITEQEAENLTKADLIAKIEG